MSPCIIKDLHLERNLPQYKILCLPASCNKYQPLLSDFRYSLYGNNFGYGHVWVWTVCVCTLVNLSKGMFFTQRHIIEDYNKLTCPRNSLYNHAHTQIRRVQTSLNINCSNTWRSTKAHENFPSHVHIRSHKKRHTNVNCGSACLAERVNRQNYWWGFYYEVKR